MVVSCGSVSIFPVTNYAEPLLMNVFAIHLCSLVRYWFKFFADFLLSCLLPYYYEFWEFFICSGHKYFIRFVIYKYSLICVLSLDNVCQGAEVLLMKSNL